MKKYRLLMSALIIFLGISILNSCDKKEDKETGLVTFGANYHIINCISNVTIYIDNVKVGTLINPTDTIKDCGEESNITKELTVGNHSYKIEIRPETGTGCTKDINGTLTISKNKCEKVFIDYLKVFSNQSDCDQNVIVSPTEYQNAPNDPFSITEITISGDCLNIKFAASGCDGNTWIVKLIDSGMIAESYPCQRTLRLSLDNKEDCMAVPTKKISFDIKDLQIVGNDKVILHVSGKEILYEY
jgi:hypothetical protein